MQEVGHKVKCEGHQSNEKFTLFQGGPWGEGNIRDGEKTELSQEIRLESHHLGQQGRLHGPGGGQGGWVRARPAENKNFQIKGWNQNIFPKKTAGRPGGQMAGGPSNKESLVLIIDNYSSIIVHIINTVNTKYLSINKKHCFKLSQI